MAQDEPVYDPGSLYRWAGGEVDLQRPLAFHEERARQIAKFLQGSARMAYELEDGVRMWQIGP